jgi:hypothetical protein
MHKRRVILLSISAVAVASAAGIPLSALAALQKVDPKDPQAAALGYTDDTTKVDKKKYPKHEPSQTCSNCQFYVAAQEESNLAPCTILGGKAVAAKGWCSAWAKKTS